MIVRATMQTKAEALSLLHEEFQQWEAIIARSQAGQSASAAREAMRKTLIHLWAWQQHSIAYLEAALQGTQPELPPWPFVITPDDEGDVDATNAWITQTYGDKSWEKAYQDWRTGFLIYLTLAERLPEQDLLDGAKYRWRGGWPLLASLEGVYEHHHEHREELPVE
jgi:hypothetical protein